MEVFFNNKHKFRSESNFRNFGHSSGKIRETFCRPKVGRIDLCECTLADPHGIWNLSVQGGGLEMARYADRGGQKSSVLSGLWVSPHHDKRSRMARLSEKIAHMVSFWKKV